MLPVTVTVIVIVVVVVADTDTNGTDMHADHGGIGGGGHQAQGNNRRK